MIPTQANISRDGRLVTDMASADGASDTLAADTVTRLRNTFDTGRSRDIDWRLGQLDALDRFLRIEEDALAAALAADLGKNDFEARAGDIGAVRMELVHARKHLREWAGERGVRVSLFQRPGKASYVYEPLGVALIIGPWNYPIQLTLGPLVGAIAAGCAAVLKPSEFIPATSEVVARRLPEYLDGSMYAVVQGDAKITQELLAQDLDHVFFTGGVETGRSVMVAAAKSLTPVTLELGGKSPVVIASDADLRTAGRRIAFAKVTNSAQTCVAPDYVLVDESVAGAFVESVRHWMTRFTSDVPPAGLRVINARHAQRLAGLLDGHGGRVALGGRASVEQLRIQPTIIVDPNLSAPLMQEEIFGPILAVVPIGSLDEAYAFIRARPHPLAAYLFSRSADTGKRFVRDVHAGGLAINQVMMHVGVAELPFGGVGPSGTGSYHGHWGFETFSHRKGVYRTPSRPDPSLVYPPYGKAKLSLLRRLM